MKKKCANNYQKEKDNSIHRCVGERKIDEGYFLFYTSGLKTKIKFKKKYVFNLFGNKLLQGARDIRFMQLQRLINETKYTTYDLS